jgi:TonB-dependent receptor
MDTKRDASGVVDAISAEDMGKFPDTNLAESLQRISGVSINRVNGEGSEVTVRGFGGGFNLVTLNGRQMPSANVGTITGNPLDQGASGSSRSFDFSNLASEGVRGLQVYKTGRASVATGGVGATINVETIRPLETDGTQISVGVKAVKDTSGDDVTPEVSGLYSWSNDDSTFGVSLFGSFQERDSGSRHASVEEFGLRTWDSSDPSNLSNLGIVEGATIINTPNDGQLVYRPTNLGLGFNEDNRERTNGLLTVQFAPNDSMTFTADAAYAENVQDSSSLIDGVWFNGTVDYVEYDGNPVVAAPVIFAEDVSGGKDFFFQNLAMGTKDTLESLGLNLDWKIGRAHV